jgi:hypothetical protein
VRTYLSEYSQKVSLLRQSVLGVQVRNYLCNRRLLAKPSRQETERSLPQQKGGKEGQIDLNRKVRVLQEGQRRLSESGRRYKEQAEIQVK